MFKSIRPEFFDIFGIFIFAFLMILSLWGLETNKPMPRLVLIALLIIGVFGFLIDSFNVYKTYFVSKK